jgi:hypothetical protein
MVGLHAEITADDAAWKQRYRIPTFSVSGVARHNPTRGVISTNKDGVGQIYSWDRATGAMAVKTDSPAGKGGGTPSKDGEWIFYHQDDKPGLEIGHYVAIRWDGATPGETVSLTPELKSYAASGLVEANDGSKIVLSAAVGGGQVIYVKDGGLDAAPVEYHRIDQLVQTGALALSPCGRYLAQSSNEHTLPTVAMDSALNVYDLSLPAGSAPIATLWDGPKTSMSGYSFVPERNPPQLVVTTSVSGFDRPFMWEPLSNTRTELPALNTIDGQLIPVCFDEGGSKLLLRQLHLAQVSLHLLDVGSGTVSSMPKQPKGLFSSAFFDKLTGDLCVGFVNESTPAMVVTLDATTGAPKKAVLPADGTLPPAGATNSGKKSVKTPPRSFESIHFASENGDEVQGWLALPADESEGPWPTILHTHGGPTSIQLQSYNPAAQAWLDAGFAWCSINYHGSTE